MMDQSTCKPIMQLFDDGIRGISNTRNKRHQHVSYRLRSHTTAGIIFNTFNSSGAIAFAFAGQSVGLEIQATIPSSLEKPSKKAMWRGVVVALCYVSVAASGYWAFGNLVEDDGLISLEKPRCLIITANLMVFIHVLGSYQVKGFSKQ